MSKIELHLLVDEEYIESFVALLPKDKVRVVEKNFSENRVLLDNVLKEYKNSTKNFIEYKDSMNDISSWLKEREK